MKNSTIRFEEAQNWKTLSELVLQKGTEFASIGDCQFTYFTSNLTTLCQYLDDWTFPKLSQVALHQGIKNHLTAFFILQQERVAGVAIVHHPRIDHCQLVCFRVVPGYRQLGLGALFLAEIVKVCRRANYQQLKVFWRTYWKFSGIWEKMLTKNAWQTLPSKMYYGVIEKPSLQMESQWYHKANQTNTYTFHKATSTQMAALKSTIQQADWKDFIPEGLNPLQLSDKLDEQASFIAKKGNTLVGWLLTHQLRAKLWQVTTVFILPTERGGGISLFAEFFNRHENRGPFNFMIQPANRKMLAFMKRYFVPAGAQLYEQKGMSTPYIKL